MSEVCYDKEEEEEETGEKSSRAARRRRMEIRRFKVVAGVTTIESENEPKRQKLELRSSSFSRDWTEYAFENCGGSEGDRSDLETENGRSETIEIVIPKRKQKAILLNEYPKFGFASVCGRRRDMEDAVAIHPSFCRRETETPLGLHYFGVYDGHGCSHVAMKCRERFHEVVKEEIQNREEQSIKWRSLMERSFFRMDKEVITLNESALVANCRCELQSPECDAVGSTAVVAVLTPDKIIVSNCGDSRAVLCRNGKAVPLSTDHKPDRPDELSRIEAAGGRVIYWDGPRILGVLAMSRAIGDSYLKPYVISEPEVTITDRTANDDCLILASDGLWDVMSNETACGVARMCLKAKAQEAGTASVSSLLERDARGNKVNKGCSDASTLLMKLAIARGSSDNVSVVVIDLKRDR